MRGLAWLREQHHNVVHLCDENLQRMPDSDIFLKAATEGRILLTVDLDFFDPYDPAALAVCIHRLLREPRLRAQLQAAGRENVRRFNWDTTVRQTLAMFEDLVRA
jgi:glycosyltransferase involved in cell wall biosynthesis